MEVQLAAESADVGGGGQAAIAAGAGFRADLGVGSVAALRASIISRGYALISASSSVGGRRPYISVLFGWPIGDFEGE